MNELKNLYKHYKEATMNKRLGIKEALRDLSLGLSPRRHKERNLERMGSVEMEKEDSLERVIN